MSMSEKDLVSDLKSQFNGDVVTPLDADYDEAIARWAVNTERQARFVCFPKDNDGVAAITKWAVENSIPMAVCGGGHSMMSSVEGGLVIGLSRYFGGVAVDVNNKVARVGGGATWKNVDETAIKYGLATVGGTCNTVGVGGSLLGGGYGFLTGEHGLAIDSLVEATIVTAEGQVIKASESDNSELFWGIRGGGGNFGVATEFVLKLYPQRRTVFAGTVVFSGTMVKSIFDALQTWWHDKPSEKEGIIAYMLSPLPAKEQIIMLLVFYNGSEIEGRENYKKIFDLGPIEDTCREVPYEEVNGLHSHISPSGMGAYMTGSTYESPDYPVKVFDKLSEMNYDADVRMLAGFLFFPLSSVNAVAPDATAFSSRGSTPNIHIVASWKEINDVSQDKAIAMATSIKDMLENEHSYSMKKGKNTGYPNFEYEERPSSSRVESVFKHNYPRLQQLKAKYDSGEVFSRWYGIVPVKA